MSAEKLYSEIFDEFDQVATRSEKIEVLKKYDHPRFRDFLVMAFNSKIQFDVEIPNYRPAVEPAGLNWTYLDIEMPRMYRFIKNFPGTENLTQEKRKALLNVVLESLHKDEAALLVKMINKKLDVKFLTPKIISEALPGINIE
jgi:hypothetical protein